MPRRKQKTFQLNAMIDGHVVAGFVSFFPAPPPGVLTEVARLDAERFFAEMVRNDIIARRV